MFFPAAPTPAAYRYYFRKVLVFLAIGVGIGLLSGCRTAYKPPYSESSTTDYYDAVSFEKPKRYEPLAMYTYRPNDFLVGNNCVTEYTKTLGFEYTYPFTQPNEQPNHLYSFFHNVHTHMRLTRRLGFGWKRKVKRRIKQCKTSSGDFRG
jgi:hypothetical protein